MTQPLPETPTIYLIATRSLVSGDHRAVMEACLDAGVDIVQLREKDPAVARETGPWLRELTASFGVPLVVNDDPRLAVELGADGVHVGQDDRPVAEVREIVGDEMTVGLSTHDASQVDAARDAGVDMIGVGPVFATTTKDAGAPVGVELVRYAMKLAPEVLVFPIGGIDAVGARRIAEAGCRSVAVSSWILAAADPAARVAELRAALGTEQDA